jgi:hypothetical protein
VRISDVSDPYHAKFDAANNQDFGGGTRRMHRPGEEVIVAWQPRSRRRIS